MNRGRASTRGGGRAPRAVDREEERRTLLTALQRYVEQELMLPVVGVRRGAVPVAAASARVSGGGQSFLPVAAGIPDTNLSDAGIADASIADASIADARSAASRGAADVGGAPGPHALIGTRVIPLPGTATPAQVAGLQEIAAACAACTACPLSGTRHNAVPGTGHAGARLVIVGEGPGENEDEQGLPFVGMAGKLLTKMLAAIHLSRDEVFITNIVKCRPPDNRVPHESEVAACRGYLERQIAIIKPDLIVPLGAPSTKFFLETPEVKITKIRGQLFQWRGIPLIPTLHPAYLLRASSAKKDAWEDLQKIRDFLATRGRKASAS